MEILSENAGIFPFPVPLCARARARMNRLVNLNILVTNLNTSLGLQNVSL